VLAATAPAAPVQADGFSDVVRAADLTIRPHVLEKRLPAPGDRAVNGPAGVLRIEFVVEHDGTVKFARVIGEADQYRPVVGDVIALLRRWKFVPGTRAGVVVRTLASLAVTYAPGGSRGGGTAQNIGTWLVEGADDAFAEGAVKLGDPGVVWARIKKDARPSYPDALRRDRINGLVSVEILIEATGRVSTARVVSSSDARFEADAVACARQWQFEPALKDGKPHQALATLVLEFRIN